MAAKHLSEGFRSIAFRLQEQADELSHNDLWRWLSDACDDMDCCLCDFIGDGQSGDAIVSMGGDMKRVGYSIEQTNGKSTATLDMENAEDVLPRTTYEPEADEADHYASMESGFKQAKLYNSLPLYERFISKAERDAADTGSFAGKGKSFPILKPGDVMAAVRSMGRAGSDNSSTATLKKNIIAIAKKKGWTKYLPKAWQGSDSTESRRTDPADGALPLMESASLLDAIVLTEAAAIKPVPIKIIAPGAGSSAFYPKEVLQRDGPKVFKSGTHVYVNHPTAAEESARPEGDAKNLAGVLTRDAEWRESHMHSGKDLGPGLYSEVKPFSDHATLFNEKGHFLGMSIRASGRAESGQKKNGLPVLSHLDSAESVDVVTRAGAGGMILTESARTAAANEGEDMDLKEVQRLIDQSNAPLRERALRGDAQVAGYRALADVSLSESAKQMVIENVMRLPLPVEGGELDQKKFGEAIEAEAKRVGAVFGSGPVVFGMGGGTSKKELKEAKRAKKELKEQKRESREVFADLGLSEVASKFAARGRVA